MSVQDELREIIKSPPKSKISTADIAVGFWSSTTLSEKLHMLEEYVQEQVDKAYDRGFEDGTNADMGDLS